MQQPKPTKPKPNKTKTKSKRDMCFLFLGRIEKENTHTSVLSLTTSYSDAEIASAGKSAGTGSFLTNVLTLDPQFALGHFPWSILTPLALSFAVGFTSVTFSLHRTQYAVVVLGVDVVFDKTSLIVFDSCLVWFRFYTCVRKNMCDSNLKKTQRHKTKRVLKSLYGQKKKKRHM